MGFELPDTLPRGQRFPVLLQAGVWLVFLVSPVFSSFRPENPLWVTCLGLLTVAVFSAVYLVSFTFYRPIAPLSRIANTAIYSVVLAVLGAILWVPASFSALSVLPYIAATWLFKHSLRVGLIATGALISFLIAACALWVPTESRPAIALWIGIAMLMVTGVRYAAEREDHTRALQDQLKLAQQREAWARDVHDVLGHSLTVVALKTELASRLIERNPAKAHAELQEILALTRQALAEVRSTVTELRTPELETQILSARSACEAAGLRFSGPGPEAANTVPSPQKGLFAWCLREAITNVVRHSGATACSVEVSPTRLIIADNGRGFAGADGNGIRGMRERCAEAGATLTIESASPTTPGTKVTVSL